jgi:hypothetical protein
MARSPVLQAGWREKMSEGRGELYLVIRSDEAELLKRPTRLSGQSIKITVAELAHEVALPASLM